MGREACPAPSRTVALLGTGLMGAAMATNLANAGFAVHAWNRTGSKARALAKEGVLPCANRAEALNGASVLITMLSDRQAVTEAVDGYLRPGLLWAQMGTIGDDATKQLIQLATDADVRFVDAPVLGTVAPALRGELIVLAGGEERDLSDLEPVFRALATRIVRAGSAGEAMRLKLTLNLWSLLTVTAMAEVLAFAERSDIAADLFLNTIMGGASDSEYARSKASLMLSRNYAPSARLRLVRKDLQLAVEGARARGLELTLAPRAVELMDQAINQGFGDADAAAVIEAFRALI